MIEKNKTNQYTYKKYTTEDRLIYDKSLELRNELLRIPIGKSIYLEDLSIEKYNDFFGAFDGSQLIGTLSFYDEENGIAHLTAFVVNNRYQNLGVGRKLVYLLSERIEKEGLQ